GGGRGEGRGPVPVGRALGGAGSAVTAATEAVCAGTGGCFALREGRLRRVDPPRDPVHERSARRVRVFDQQREILYTGRHVGEAQRRGDGLPLAGVPAGGVAPLGGNAAGERPWSCPPPPPRSGRPRAPPPPPP